MKVTTQEQARQVLLAGQMSEGDEPVQPDSGATVETEAGWAFFNVNGYLGTVTEDGDVIEEEEFAAENHLRLEDER
jgi:hypothetical protein